MCARGVYRAGCVGSRGAVVGHRGSTGAFIAGGVLPWWCLSSRRREGVSPILTVDMPPLSELPHIPGSSQRDRHRIWAHRRAHLGGDHHRDHGGGAQTFSDISSPLRSEKRKAMGHSLLERAPQFSLRTARQLPPNNADGGRAKGHLSLDCELFTLKRSDHNVANHQHRSLQSGARSYFERHVCWVAIRSADAMADNFLDQLVAEIVVREDYRYDGTAT